MYSDKENILQLVVSPRVHGVTKVVLCPGSRNVPTVHTLTGYPDFTCHSVTDERSAGFSAIELVLHGGKPTAVCCMSGTTLLNLHPAVAETYYQKVSLVVISADRPTAQTSQIDGQTLPQSDVFQSLMKMSANLPEVHTDEDKWYCNRLLSETLLELSRRGKGPVHINVPVLRPLFQFTAGVPPEERVMTRCQGLNVHDRDYDGLINRLNKYNRRMVAVGQMNLIYLFEKKYSKMLYKQFAWFTGHLGNQTAPGIPIRNFDAVSHAMSPEMQEKIMSELVTTYGGHVVSKRVKKFPHQHLPKEHRHVSTNGEAIGLSQGPSITVIEMDPFELLEKTAFLLGNRTLEHLWQWENFCKELPQPELPYSGMSAIGALTEALPASCALYLADSSIVRYAQLYPLPDIIEIRCNHGTSGIEGSLSIAVGYAVTSGKLNFVIIGDLSFFYGMNASWNNYFESNLRILLLDDGGGEIFHTLPGLEMSGTSRCLVIAVHRVSTKGWTEECGFLYQEVQDKNQLDKTIKVFTQAELLTQSMLMEILTNKNKGAHILEDCYHQPKRQDYD